jgi:hypothetical protein
MYYIFHANVKMFLFNYQTISVEICNVYPTNFSRKNYVWHNCLRSCVLRKYANSFFKFGTVNRGIYLPTTEFPRVWAADFRLRRWLFQRIYNSTLWRMSKQYDFHIYDYLPRMFMVFATNRTQIHLGSLVIWLQMLSLCTWWMNGSYVPLRFCQCYIVYWLSFAFRHICPIYCVFRC